VVSWQARGKKKLTQKEADDISDRIVPIVDLAQALNNADLVIEAVPEDMNLKKKVYTEIDKFADSKMIFASNTSTLPITEMASLTQRPEKFVGVHFFNPPQLMQLVEVIPGAYTNEDTIHSVTDFVKRVGKQPVLCRKDVAGFIVNRIFIPLVHEAVYSQERDHVSMTQIDSAVKFRMSFPMGIFELADYTGLDVIYKATTEMYMRDKNVVNPNPKIRELVDENKLGQKSGQGFYEYKGDTYQRINLTEDQAATYDPIKLLAVAANNAGWLISNEVCDLQDLEKALKLGMGLKTELFRIVQQFGIENIIQTLNKMQEKYGTFYRPDQYLLNYPTR
jgi:enoyl-CoA hydratase / 3-hydroxyacyl-CoA dehydrogenase